MEPIPVGEFYCHSRQPVSLVCSQKTVSVPGGHGLDVVRRRDMIQPPLGTPCTVEKLAIVFNFIRDSIFC